MDENNEKEKVDAGNEPQPGVNPSTIENNEPNPTSTAASVKKATAGPKEKEAMIPLSDVKKMIAEILAQNAEDKTAHLRPKKVKEHTAHIHRFDGKWVVDFKDRNTDPYVKVPIHAFNKWNEQVRRFEPWVELIFDDGSTKEIMLFTYLKNRVSIQCPIVSRNQIDKSFIIGEVEKKKEVGDRLVGTGIMVDQEVNRYDEVFELMTPDKVVRKLPDYVIA